MEYVEGEALTTWCDTRKLGVTPGSNCSSKRSPP